MNWWTLYKNYVSSVLLTREDAEQSIAYWRNRIFLNLLIYITPLSILALIPGVYVSFMKGLPILGSADIFVFLTLLVIMLYRGLTLRFRKILFLSVFYFLSVVLVYFLGAAGPGRLYLLFLTILTSIIYSSSAGYYSAWINTFVCIIVGISIYLKAHIPVNIDYSFESWIAISSNLVLLSFASAKCLELLLNGLTSSLVYNNTSDEKLNKTSRAYRFISQINKSVSHFHDEKALFLNSCKVAYETGTFRIAWIGTIDSSQNKVTVANQYGIPEQDIYRFSTNYDKGGPQAHVLQTGSFYVCNNIVEELELTQWKPFASENNIKSCMVLPLKKGGVITATLNLYSEVLNFFDDVEIDLLEVVAEDISFALDFLENERAHKESQEQIIKNEMRFRTLIEYGTDAVAIISADGRVQYISASIEKILGYSEEEAMKLDMFTLVHPNDIADVVKVWEKVLATSGIPVPGATGRFKHKDGSWRWIEGTLTNMLHDPSINGIVDNFRDITEKVLFKEQQDFDRNNLDALINNTADLMWSVDRDFNLLTSNAPFDKLITLMTGSGLPKGSSVFSKAFSPPQLERFKIFYTRAFTGEVFMEIEESDSHFKYWFETSYCPIYHDNHIIGVACHARDITQIKQAEQLLRSSEAFNTGVLNSLSSHIAVLDGTGNIVAVNELWERFALENKGNTLVDTGVGCNYFEVCERSVAAGDPSAAIALQSIKDVLMDKKDLHNLEYPCHSPTEKRWFSMRVTKFDNDEAMVVVEHVNITKKKLAEEEREKMISNIVQHSKNLEQFASIVSHNLRAPVAHILGLSIVLKNDISDEDRARTHQFLFTATEQLDDVLRDLNKILQVRSEINEYKELISFPDVVDVIKSSIHNLIETEGVKILTNFHDIDSITSIKSYVHSFFYNLISNSIKYRQPGVAPIIRIESTCKNGKIRISFKDNGLGLDLTRHGDKIFGLYKRFHLNIEGKGMGLFIVKTQVETLGGTISVESRAGEGADFIIELPL